MSDTVIERLREFSDSLLPAMGLELFDIQYRREGHGWVLRLIIDKPDGVTLDDCSRVSRETSDFLDVEDLIEHPYHLEVSSPGLERPLRSVEECGRQLGKKARFKLKEAIDGQRVLIGDLQAVEDNTISVLTEEGRTYALSWETIVKARLTL
jgi:ribosome maturation factor RimP